MINNINGIVFVDKDAVIVPYKVDLTDMTFKGQFFFRGGGCYAEWNSLKILESYTPVKWATDMLLEEDDVNLIFKEFDKGNLIDLRAREYTKHIGRLTGFLTNDLEGRDENEKYEILDALEYVCKKIRGKLLEE